MFVGAKMLAGGVYDVPTGVSLGVIAAILTTAVTAPLVSSNSAEQKEIQ